MTLLLWMAIELAYARQVPGQVSPPVIMQTNPGDFEAKVMQLPPIEEQPLARIAIIDTGYNPGRVSGAKLKLCKDGHFDFFSGKPIVAEGGHPHGTIVGEIIGGMLEQVNYCAVIYNVANPMEGVSFNAVVQAINMASRQRLQAVNISLEGPAHSYFERGQMELLALSGARVFVAAGNDNKNLDQVCNSFPSCYKLPGVVIVGALTNDYSQKATYSNYGSLVQVWHAGSVKFDGQVVSGTSYASPRALADYIISMVILGKRK